MPYKLVRRTRKGNTQYCVVKSDSGATVKCHPTREKALKHLAALKINVEDA